MKVWIQQKNLASFLLLVIAQRLAEKTQREKDNVSSVNINIQNTLKHLHTNSIGGGPKAEDKDTSQSRKLQSYKSHGFMSKTCTKDDQMKTLLKSANPVNACYRESGQSKTLYKANPSCNQNLQEGTFEKKDSVSQSSDRVFKHPNPIVKNRKQQLPVTGCIAVGKSLNSRNFSKLLHSCPYQCDRHKVIVEAEDRYKSELRKSLIYNKKILLTPRKRQLLSNERTSSGGIKERKIRKNFTEEEVNYIFSGVKKMGNHWNAILWSFPFQQGRKSVDLAQKYHKLTRRPKFVAP
ncbi:telomere repeats-binding bouquet formation protein 1 isoform X3 [Myotis lucifugus]|uniref:telomere repeats-binding bouquet formation protein 1 isoform X3 n=1 Tax=Myotis lucifugus TaxID=59463 RepID=UPI000CCC5B52|nr:telomere repeats-binding bouquet formation protein 1 isoform X3 [Myotis lucifugus]